MGTRTTNEQARAAIEIMLDGLTQFAYGEIDPTTTPWQGDVTLSPVQHDALVDWLARTSPDSGSLRCTCAQRTEADKDDPDATMVLDDPPLVAHHFDGRPCYCL